MKRFFMVTVLVAALMMLLAGTGLAQDPAAPAAQGYGPGRGAPAQDSTSGTCPMGGAGAHQMRGLPAWAGQPDEIATLLGMTAEEIQAERQAGKSLAQIAADKGIRVEQLVDTILTAKKTTLAQLVVDGKLTQAQADQMIERMTEQVKGMVERTTTGPKTGRSQGMGMRGGRFNR